MKRFILFCLLLFHSGVSITQVISPSLVCSFPDSLNESSGIIAIDSIRILTHNDSGDTAVLYLYNTSTCLIEKEIYINSYTAKDFEAITMDDSGFVYVADFGNNFADRNDLAILKIDLDDILNFSTVNFQPIYFSYSDQTSTGTTTHNYDCEAFFHFNDSLFLFSKNHGIAGTYCKRYALPDLPQTYILSPLDSMSFPNWITDAAISPSKQEFVLTSEEKLISFDASSGLINFNMLNSIKDYSFVTKKEGICFLGNDNFFITDELFVGTGGNIYSLDPSAATSQAEIASGLLNGLIYHDNNIRFLNSSPLPVYFEIYDICGQQLEKGVINPTNTFSYYTSSRGILKLTSDNRIEVFKF